MHVEDWLTIGQLAERTGISAKAIRYYESTGLLPQPPRKANRYRRYDTADVNRLGLLRRTRLLGVPLAMARSLLLGASDARCTEVQSELLALVEKRLRGIDQEIAKLQQLRTEVEGYRQQLEVCYADANLPFCACPDLSCIAGPATYHKDRSTMSKPTPVPSSAVPCPHGQCPCQCPVCSGNGR